MTEGQLVDHVIALGFVVLDDDQGYKICRQFNPDSWLARIPRHLLLYLTRPNIDTILALALSNEATAL